MTGRGHGKDMVGGSSVACDGPGIGVSFLRQAAHVTFDCDCCGAAVGKDERLLRVITALFDIHGRLSRGGFILFAFAGSACLVLIAWLLRDELPERAELLLLVLSPLAALSILAVIRRLHDRGRSGWWFLVIYVVPIFLLASSVWLLDLLRANGLSESTARFARPVFVAVAMTPLLWAFVELYFLRGTRGPNRFGPDPVKSAASRSEA